MKKGFVIIASCAAIKLIIHLIGNQNYGFHRDELLHLSVSEHLAWGYMEFPPFIAFVGKLADSTFGYSLEWVRFFPTLAGLLILVACCLMAKELGGRWRSILFSGACVLAFLPFYRNHTLFQPVAFDQLFWTLGFLLLIKYNNSSQQKHLFALAVIVGLGFLTKYTMAFWLFGALVGLAFYEKGKIYRSKWLYLAGLVSLIILLPNAIWQWQHDFPVFNHLNTLSENQLEGRTMSGFVLDQVTLVSTFLVSLLGLWFAARSTQYRWIAISTILIFLSMMILRAKTYYVYPIYPVLFAAGAVQLEQWLEDKKAIWSYLLAVSIVLPFVYFIPDLTPVLPIEQYVAYKGLEKEDGRYILEESDYADMFGWEEQVLLVDSLYRSLSEEERERCVIWAENYGEAGAIKILGKRYGLPNPVSRHGTFWTWGSGREDAEVWISLGNEQPSVERAFNEVQLVRMVWHDYAIEEEQNIPVYLLRNPKVNIKEWWQSYEEHIFD